MAERRSFMAGIVAELLLLLGTIVSGIAAAAGVGVTLANWNYNCIFNIEVACSAGFLIEFVAGTSYLCDFCVRVQVFAVVFSAVFAAYRIMVLVSRKYNIEFLRIATSGGFGLFSVIILANAIIISVGLASFCSKLQNTCPVYKDIKCTDFQDFKWEDDYGSTFYSATKVAEIAAWTSFLCWLGLAILSFVLFIEARRANRQMVLTPVAIPATTAAVPVAESKPV